MCMCVRDVHKTHLVCYLFAWETVCACVRELLNNTSVLYSVLVCERRDILCKYVITSQKCNNSHDINVSKSNSLKMLRNDCHFICNAIDDKIMQKQLLLI